MALSTIPSSGPGSAGADARERINAAIRALNDVLPKVDGKQEAFDLAGLLSRISSLATASALADEAMRRGLADAGEAQARRALASDLQAEIGGKAELADLAALLVQALTAISAPDRPGINPAAFGPGTLGPVAGISSLDPASAVATALGRAYLIAGAGLIAPRASIAVDPDAISILRAHYWRNTDVLDPNNNAVDIGIQWLDAADGDAGRTLIRRETNLMVQDGPHMLTARVPSFSGEVPAIVAPKGAVSWRPYLRTYGADGATAVSVLGVADATFAGVYAPDVSALTARLKTLEGQIAAGLPFATPILPSYAVADLPRPGNRGRKAFARDGRAPNVAGALEAANAGTGVEVTDNGTAWVITGTNQQVQA